MRDLRNNILTNHHVGMNLFPVHTTKNRKFSTNFTRNVFFHSLSGRIAFPSWPISTLDTGAHLTTVVGRQPVGDGTAVNDQSTRWDSYQASLLTVLIHWNIESIVVCNANASKQCWICDFESYHNSDPLSRPTQLSNFDGRADFESGQWK